LAALEQPRKFLCLAAINQQENYFTWLLGTAKELSLALAAYNSQ
jgi:hypothetical protein